MLIIGITGTIGAGKGTIVKYIVEKYNFKYFSVREFLRKEAINRGFDNPDRDIFTQVANDLRATHSPSYIVDQLYQKALSGEKNAIIESIRSPGEITSLRAKGPFILIAIDADPKIRYERIRNRKSETDHISFETFSSNEQREMHSDNPDHQNLSACIAQADFLIENCENIDELHNKLEDIFEQLNP